MCDVINAPGEGRKMHSKPLQVRRKLLGDEGDGRSEEYADKNALPIDPSPEKQKTVSSHVTWEEANTKNTPTCGGCTFDNNALEVMEDKSSLFGFMQQQR